MSLLEFDSVTVSWSSGREDAAVRALEGVALTIEPGQIVSIMGPNGCGKSTLLRLAAGLLRPTEGRVLWGGAEIEGPAVDRAFMPQQPKLFEWLSICENVAFGAKMRNVGRKERGKVALELLDRLGLKSWSKNYPSELSGGMRGRVALAMTLANDPKLICLDESFGAMDYQTRLVSLQMLLDVWQKGRPSIILVTHHVSEAMLADRVLVFSGRPGKIVLDRRVQHNGWDRIGLGRTEDAESLAIIDTTLRTAALAAFEWERTGVASERGSKTDMPADTMPAI